MKKITQKRGSTMKKFSNILYALVLFVICLLLLPTKSQAASESGLTFTLNAGDQSYSVKATDKTIAGDLVIPATYNGKPVTTIGAFAFQDCDKLTAITIPDSVVSISGSAFYDCDNLTDVTIGQGVTYIGTLAFSACDNLKKVHITNLAAWCGIRFDVYLPDYGGEYYANPLEFADNLYLNGELVTDLVIPNNITKIDSAAFYGYKNLTSVIVGENVQSVGNSAFQNCSKLRAVLLTNSVDTIGSYAFYDCDNLETVYFKGTQAEWEQISFQSGNKKLTNAQVIFNYTETNIPVVPDTPVEPADYLIFELSDDGHSYVVTDCNVYASGELIVPETYNNKPVTAIDSYAFSDCFDLTDITIPSSVNTIGKGAFSGCTSLKSITLPFVGDSTKTLSDTQHHFGYYFTEFYQPGPNLGNDNIIVTNKPNYHINIYDTYGSLEGDSSNYAIPKSLKSVTVTGGKILPLVFEDCSNLTDITLPDGITSIGLRAFSGCSNLTNITIPGSVTLIEENAFSFCRKLKTIQFTGTRTQWNAIKVNGATITAEVIFLGGEDIQPTTLPSTAPATTATIKPTATQGTKPATTQVTTPVTTQATEPAVTTNPNAALVPEVTLVPAETLAPNATAPIATEITTLENSESGILNTPPTEATDASTSATSAAPETEPATEPAEQDEGSNAGLIIAIVVIVAIIASASGVATFLIIKKKTK